MVKFKTLLPIVIYSPQLFLGKCMDGIANPQNLSMKGFTTHNFPLKYYPPYGIRAAGNVTKNIIKYSHRCI